MPANIRQSPANADIDLPVLLGPRGPFPEINLSSVLERRWLHYAFVSRDSQLGLVANIAWLGPDPELGQNSVRNTSILTVFKRGEGWRSSQFNCETYLPVWSAFRKPYGFVDPHPFQLVSTSGSPYVRFSVQRSCRPGVSQCALFGGNTPIERQHMRWQCEPGIIARGDWGFDGQVYPDVEAIGYHERIRGCWGWPELGGWVWGFANDPAKVEPGAAPPTALVFGIVQPDEPHDAAGGSVMLWRDGRLARHFPRRNISVAARGQLDRDKVLQVPELANISNVPSMQPIPRRLTVVGSMGDDRVSLDFLCEAATRVVVPNETGIDPFSVHEVIGPCQVEGRLNGKKFEFQTYGIVEFAGGARAD